LWQIFAIFNKTLNAKLFSKKKEPRICYKIFLFQNIFNKMTRTCHQICFKKSLVTPSFFNQCIALWSCVWFSRLMERCHEKQANHVCVLCVYVCGVSCCQRINPLDVNDSQDFSILERDKKKILPNSFKTRDDDLILPILLLPHLWACMSFGFCTMMQSLLCPSPCSLQNNIGWEWKKQHGFPCKLVY
jgi:hypothetical protein